MQVSDGEEEDDVIAIVGEKPARVVTRGDDVVVYEVENYGDGGAGVQPEVAGGRSYLSQTEGTDVAPIFYKVCFLVYHWEIFGCNFPLTSSCVVLPTVF